MRVHSPLSIRSQKVTAEEYRDRVKVQPAKSLTEATAKTDWPAAIKILFPSESFVTKDYILGPDGAGTFFGKSTHFLQNG